MANTCAICDAVMPGPWQEYPDYPFCSKRCRLVDLGRWLDEDYTLAATRQEDAKSDEPR
jgi:hypothetical protein